MKHTNVRLRESQTQAVEDISRESKRREDLPDLSKSEVIRRLLDAGLDEAPEVADLVTESTRVEMREERFMEDQGSLRNKRTGFETQVKRHFKKRFENGFRPEQLEEFAVNMRMKARCYWPEDIGDDYSERREQALAYVDALLDEAKEASAASEYDPLDPSEVFGGYASVESGTARQDIDMAELIDVATDRLRRGASDEEALADALAKQHSVTDDVARDAVDLAVEKAVQNGGVGL